MKTFVLLLAAAGLLWAQDQDRAGNFTIRFGPDADLQTKVEVPFAIHVTDDLGKPVENAKVTLQIETPQHTNVQVFKAPATDRGLYVAKPVFPSPGPWSVYVEVRRDGLLSARTLEFTVPSS
ncbi:MAG TPA: FixH family protein [Bryobacteraceae bacterium]|nr:FixH family protein [Bryobacteraceae bacterium]